MKERPILMSGPMVRAILEGRKTQTRRVVNPQPVLAALPGVASYSGFDIACPYGVAGDRLWVREAWLRDRYDGSTQYRASHPCPSGPKWKPSIHMPRERCRLVLEVTGVRVERLKDINGLDAIAEGIDRVGGEAPWRTYRRLWDSLNAQRSFGWATNPWVWVIQFRRLDALKEAA